jgi:hypothetical protein
VKCHRNFSDIDRFVLGDNFAASFKEDTMNKAHTTISEILKMLNKQRQVPRTLSQMQARATSILSQQATHPTDLRGHAL